ncbi:MAG TPA: flagellar filament capping protein FliD [Pirellulaceae bacterium]|nr:flagellar filament capping protein FliD [Pirellulaceae bacterium]
MGRIQSTTGIISGIPIVDTVDQLIKLQAQPRDALVARATKLQSQQSAIGDLTAVTIALQISVKKLLQASTFSQKTVTSANTSVLKATANSANTPANGNYRFTAVRQATSQQLLSTGFATRDQAIGAGEFALQFGGNVDKSVELGALNGGAGVNRGKIRITDRAGDSAVVDLRFVQTVDDVIKAINQTDAIQVSAVADGDRIKLIDRTGETTSNLKVAEVSGGSTAADLGLSGIDTATNEATGGDIYKLYAGLDLNRLNDGNGLSIRGELADLNVSLRDGTSLQLNFKRKASSEDFATATTTGDADAQITLTAKAKGAAADKIRINFVDDAGVTAGSETVVYDDSDPDNKTLTVHIDAGNSTADNVISALTADPDTSALFTVARATGSNGSGIVTASDTAVTSGGTAVAAKTERTLGELLETINSVDPLRLKAEFSADGDRIVLKDLTADHGGTFAVTDTPGGSLAKDLGLAGTAVGGTLTGERVQGGLKTTLLRTFNGGSGLGTLGSIRITDRAGGTADVDLSNAETLDDVIAAVNATNIGVEARVNSSKNGLEIVDTSGAIANNFKIESLDVNDAAAKLNITTDSTATSVNSGTYNRQTVSENTLLSSLNGGKGVARTSFFVSDATGSTTVIRLDNDSIQTVGDLIDAFNGLSIGVEASLNANGDGIQVVDTSNGTGAPSIRDVGAGTAVKDLHLDGGSKDVIIDGDPKKAITSSSGFKLEVSATDTLNDVVTKLNALNGGFTASIISDGSGLTPHRLSIQSNIVGYEGQLQVDSSYAGTRFEELVEGHDALLQLGSGESNSAGVLLSSKSNTFTEAVAGIDITLSGQSTEAISVTVAQNDASVVTTVQLFVDQYNKLRDKLSTYTAFDANSQKATGVLFGSLEALRVDTELSSLMSGRFNSVGSISSLKELGLDLNDAGKMTFDSSKLTAKLASNPDAVKKFFSTEKSGFAAKTDKLIETFSGVKSSLLVNKAQSIQSRIQDYTERVSTWNARLNRSREAMLAKFYKLESTIAKIQNNMTAIQSIQYISADGT